MLLRSRVVAPVSAPPFEDGAVAVSGDRIEAVGRWSDLKAGPFGSVVDLGASVLLPGLINAHCHLDFTGFAGHIAPPRSFTSWIQSVLALKAEWSFSEYAGSWITGARQLLESGCTSVLDIESVPELLPDAWSATPLRVISALEMTGVRAARAPEELVEQTLGVIDSLAAHERSACALAPHAPYSTRPGLVQLVAREARRRGLLVTMHVAESEEEFRMFHDREGALAAWLGPQRGLDDCGGTTPLAQVAKSDLLNGQTVLAHMNYLGPGDYPLLASACPSVAHCPRSHAYFGHAPFPWEKLRESGVNLCLGTDSLLTVRKTGRALPRLDFFAELESAARAMPGLGPDEILRMATLHGARALGRANLLGALEPGRLADMIAIPFEGAPAGAAEAVVHNRAPLVGSMIGGQWAIAPGRSETTA
jgi:cytosine/adenosine deaminase-related metal-dependent hydrolase